MSARLEVSPRQRIEMLLQRVLTGPVVDLPLLPVNRAEWERIDTLYRPLLQDLWRRLVEASDIEEIDALGRIARGLIAQRQAELEELRRYVAPPAKSEPLGPDSSASGSAAAGRALAALRAATAETDAEEAGVEWQPLTFIGLGRLRPWLSRLEDLFDAQAGRVALATQLGFRFQASHTSPHELARRLLLELLVRQAGCETVVWSAIPARYRPAWDVWGADGGVVGSVQADLRLDGLVPLGSRVLWARQAVVADGVGYLVLTGVLTRRQTGSALFDELLWRQRWQRAVVESMLPRPSRKVVAEARATISALRAALRQALEAGVA